MTRGQDTVSVPLVVALGHRRTAEALLPAVVGAFEARGRQSARRRPLRDARGAQRASGAGA